MRPIRLYFSPEPGFSSSQGCSRRGFPLDALQRSIRSRLCVMSDLKFAFRQLLKNPGFTAVAVLTLALGIGANTAVFSVINAVLFLRLPFPNADRLVLVGETNTRGQPSGVSPANFIDWKEQSQLLEDMSARVDWGGYELTGELEPEQVIGVPASAGVFHLLKVPPLLGR